MGIDWGEVLVVVADAIWIAVKVGARVALVAGFIAAAIAFAALVFVLTGRWPWFVRRLL
ncbi:MAG: hypothetical protein AB7E81_04500 [Hyphomicrobiaceae bacterium]|jgi:hypothetical protein